ncbi:MAG TPA: polysaccharide pyruvyl transferase CsaB [Armatimonadota bacterium]|jgi:polysaccharide pyruvyl transferase CsaB
MRMLISGYYGFDNLGDEAILAALVQELRRWPEVEPVVLSQKPSLTEEVYGVAAVARDSILGLWEEMGRADLLLSGGGGLFQNSTSQLSLVYYLSILELAARRGTPYVVLGQGLGPLRGPGVMGLMRRYLEKAEAVVLRDAESVRLTREMGVAPGKVTEAADLALLLQPAGSQVAEALRQSVGLAPDQPVAGVVLRSWGGREPWEATAEMIDTLQARGVRCLLLPFQPTDVALAWRIASATQEEPAVLGNPVAPAEMLALVGTLEMMVTMRLHGLIFAAAQQVAALGLSYDPKVAAFAGQAGQKLLPLEKLTGQTLSIAASEVWEAREAQATARAEEAKRLRQSAAVNFEVLGEVIDGLGKG